MTIITIIEKGGVVTKPYTHIYIYISFDHRVEGEISERSGGGLVSTKATFTLKYVPETAVGVSLNLKIVRNQYGGYSTISVYTYSRSYSCSATANHEWANNAASCDLNIQKSHPQKIDYRISNDDGGGVSGSTMATKAYIDDLSSY